MKNTITASILNADFRNFQTQVEEAISAGIDWLHLDIMDGHFVPNISMGPSMAKTCRSITDIPIDAHLMITNPNEYIPRFAENGVNLISVHIEQDAHIDRTIQNIKKCGCKAGVVLNPGTPVHTIEEVLPLVDLVLVMSVNPGFGGQAFIPTALDKVKKIKKMIDKLGKEIHLQVDGGVTTENLPALLEAGADSFVIGSAIFRSKKGIKAAVEEIRSILDK